MRYHRSHDLVLAPRHIRPSWTICGRPREAFHLAGLAGLAAALAIALVLTHVRGLSMAITGAAATGAVLFFLAYAMAVKIASGSESLVFYRAAGGAVAAAAVTAYCLGRPSLPYAEIAVLGIGAFTAFGRLGCAMVGCCHGVPARVGFRYGGEHVSAGFPQELAGLTLAPVQAAEAMLLAAITAVGTAIAAGASAAGGALAWFVIAYGAGRFALEFLRGDADRPVMLGFTEAQWTALATIMLVELAERAELLPGTPWHHAAPPLLVGTMIVITLGRYLGGRYLGGVPCGQLLAPRHRNEIARAVRAFMALPTAASEEVAAAMGVQPIVTSLGVCISGRRIVSGRYAWYYIAVSRRGRALDGRSMEALGLLVARLCDGRDWELREGRHGVVHVLIEPASDCC